MELLLTDRLACPRCGPEFGLILRADRMADRRVHEGVIGCPNCRDSFPVQHGFVDLRPPPRGGLPSGLASSDDPVASMSDRLVALLGLMAGGGTVAMVGAPALVAGEVAASVEGLQVVAIDALAESWEEVTGVSRMVAGATLPFFSRMLRGVVVDGRLDAPLLSEAARVAGPGARVVVVYAPEGAAKLLEQSGCSVLAEEAGTIVAARS